MWNQDAWADLARLFMPEYGYSGYKPDVAEAPNGDSRIDRGIAGKRYLHVATKYNPPGWALDYLARAHFEACLVAARLGVSREFFPRAEFGALRVLEYPSAACEYQGVITGNGHWRCVACGHKQMASPGGPSDRVCPALAAGAGTAEHTDFDLFTLNLWRTTPEDHECATSPGSVHEGEWIRGASPWHIGEIGQLVGLGSAIPHRVPARPYAQRALVYFAIPDHAAVLAHPGEEDCLTVGDWLFPRTARSRVAKGSY